MSPRGFDVPRGVQRAAAPGEPTRATVGTATPGGSGWWHRWVSLLSPSSLPALCQGSEGCFASPRPGSHAGMSHAKHVPSVTHRVLLRPCCRARGDPWVLGKLGSAFSSECCAGAVWRHHPPRIQLRREERVCLGTSPP